LGQTTKPVAIETQANIHFVRPQTAACVPPFNANQPITTNLYINLPLFSPLPEKPKRKIGKNTKRLYTVSKYKMIWPYSYSAGLLLFLSLCSVLVVNSTTPKKPLINAKLLNSKIDVKKTYKVGPEEKYNSVQAAIDAVPEGNSQWVVVHVKAGTYRYSFYVVWI
jgi:hypothetical protein